MEDKNQEKRLNQKQEVDKKKKHIFLKIVLIIITLIIIAGGVFAYFIMNKLSEIKGEDITVDKFSEEVVSSTKSSEISNIALFGLDTRTDTYDEEDNRTDTIMVISVDPKNKKTTMTSYARDTMVKIEGHGYNRINAAYAYGGVSLAINTLNYNFDLNVSKYVIVNFYAVPKLVDAVGGVDIDIRSEEIYQLNKNIKEYNELTGSKIKLITKSGINRLDGGQALGYMRIRKVGNADFERMERQRTVLTDMFNKILKLNYVDIFNLINENIKYVKTNLKMQEIGALGMQLLKNGTDSLETRQMPELELLSTNMVSGSSFVIPRTLKTNVINWYKAVYGIDHTISDRVNAVSNYVNKYN